MLAKPKYPRSGTFALGDRKITPRLVMFNGQKQKDKWTTEEMHGGNS